MGNSEYIAEKLTWNHRSKPWDKLVSSTKTPKR